MNAREEEKERVAVEFTDAEADFLAEHGLCRLATVSKSMQPHVVPVAYAFDGTSIYFGGWSLTSSKKYRDIMANCKVAVVIDDLASTSPWVPSGVEIEGRAEPIEAGGSPSVRIVPTRKRSWGLGRD